MRTIKKYSGWMAEEIAKSYLLGTNIVQLHKVDSGKFDFIITKRDSHYKRIGIQVKGSKYTKRELLKIYRLERQRCVRNKFPVIMLYINYDTKKGLIEVIDKRLTDQLIPLTTEILKREIKRITARNTRN